MALTIEGGKGWLYYSGQLWESISPMPIDLKSDMSDIYLSAEKSTDAVSIHPNEEGAYVSVYRSPSMPGRPNIEVVELVGAVEPQQIPPTMSYKLGPGPAALYLNYGNMARLLIITVNGLVQP